MTTTASDLQLRPFDLPLGAQVYGLDAALPPDPDAVKALKQALADYGVVVLRQQHLDDEAAQVRFSEAFGETIVPWLYGGEANTFARRHELSKRPAYTGVHPSCVYWVNSPDYWDNPNDGYAQDWHADVSYLQNPLHYSFLYALQAPDEGYQTWFASQYAAYDRLDEDTRQRIAPLSISHEFKSAFPNLSGALHPLVLKHPISGRKALYGIPGYTKGYPVGLTEAEGRALMARLEAHIQEEDAFYKHVWQTGDLVIWDNRCVLHRRGPQVQGQTRILRRTVAADGDAQALRRYLLGF
jgi:alpha-ketoglutarate-dependent taurine dioxygenase